MFKRTLLLPIACWCAGTLNASADVITDWNEKAVAFVTPRMVPAAGQRVVEIVQVAMFDAVNSIERRYRPYLVQLSAVATASKPPVPCGRPDGRLSGRHQSDAQRTGWLAAGTCRSV